MFELDHLAIAAETLEEGHKMAEQVLGVPLHPGGQHAHFGTHNMLLGLEDGLYLEVITIDPNAPKPAHARWFDLDQFKGAPRLNNWICRTEDMGGSLAALPQAGNPVALTRGDLRWQMAVPENGQLPFDNKFPALIEWQCEAHPAVLLPASGCRLEQLIVRHPEMDKLKAQVVPLLQDSRVTFEEGPAALIADIKTPGGVRRLQ